MSPTEISKLRMELLTWLSEVGDEDILAELSIIKERSSAPKGIESLPPNQKDRILKGIEQADNGETISSEALWAQLVSRRAKRG